MNIQDFTFPKLIITISHQKQKGTPHTTPLGKEKDSMLWNESQLKAQEQILSPRTSYLRQ